MALNVVMFGPPGAGKGTQASRLATERGIPQISTGDILRGAVQAGTELGRRAKAILDAGELVSDEIMVGIVRQRLAERDAENGFILDGFPRTVAQASALDTILEGRDSLVVVELAVPDEELVSRLSQRRVCANCGAIVGRQPAAGASSTCGTCGGELGQRSDDREDVVRERLRVYHEQTAPLVDYYSGRARFRSLDGSQLPELVASAVSDAVDSAVRTTG